MKELLARRNYGSISELTNKCKAMMVCKSSDDVFNVLKEFVDHRLLVLHTKEDIVAVNLSSEQILRYSDVRVRDK